MSDTLWNVVQQRRNRGPLPHGYPEDTIKLYSPEDQVHSALVDLIGSVQHSLVLNMYGYDDDQLDGLIRQYAQNPKVYVQISLDRSQAGGVHERQLLEKWAGMEGTSVAIGQSTGHAISHLKVCIVDGLYLIGGSTNWSLSGEQKQDNELTIHRSAILAAEARSILDRNHTAMLRQMQERKPSA